jgi:aerobic-type carbon monoxide dehydrogenase small subunit (CoxS/CutS family)
MKINLVVNGKRETVDADPAMPLLYALRDDLKLNNPKFGCGRAQCGACTVHVNGVATRSCVTPVGSAADKNITTLSGLGTAEKPHPLQTAYIAEQGPAVRLLPLRLDDDRRRAAARQSEAQ